MSEINWTEEQKQQDRLELEKMVENMKKAENRGERITPVSLQEIRRERLAAENIMCVGDVIKQMLPKLEEMSILAQKHAETTLKQAEQSEPQFCLDHPEQKLPIDNEATIGKSWQKNRLVVVCGRCPLCQKEKKAI